MIVWRALFARIIDDGDMSPKNMALLNSAEPRDSHARFATTERYGHLDDAHVRQAKQKIADAIERPVG